ncbi:MAG: thiamine pyrophosphate-dependent dehydrogenase E1 component subunit alpha [Synergistaceae bacterium]|jgi:pyruvate dehydrogenase E1 component alpha subunit|nr:thiamine pyrophosphate-dependent dehydrogenase E1 component subunit alpha [Synergistaceae bacterium]
MDHPKDVLKDRQFMERVMEYMMLVNKFEEQVFALFAQGKVHGTTHLGIGEEGTGVGSVFALEERDYIFATHRGHGQVISKGAPVKNVMAEILARQAGANHGRGGSMHIADVGVNALCIDGVLGQNCPIACGVGLSFKMKKQNDRIVAVFFGDGSMNQGAVHEAMNLAAVWELPVLFICVNNTYGMSTPLHKVSADTDLSKRGYPFGIKSVQVDGNDVLAVYETVREAREYIMKEGKPAFVVENTYRTSGHSKSDANQYRTKEEIAEWKAKSPIARFRKVMLENGFTEAEVDAIDERAAKTIDEATAYAESCPDASATPEQIEAEAYA